MPVTARLSRKFYETFGDEVTDELVTWLNAADQAYRTEFRELFEAHFGRLEAVMGRMAAELRAEFRAEIAAAESRLTDRMFRSSLGTVATLLGLQILFSKLGWM